MAETNNNKFYSLVNDTTFKFLFKKEKTRKIFERIIKYYTDIDLEGYTFIDDELNTGDNLKDYRLDSILVSEDKKHIVNIEMNKEDSNYVLLKNRTYLHRIAGNLLKQNEDYSKIKDYYIEQVNFNNFYCKEEKRVEVNTYKLTDNKYNLTIENFKIHNIFIPKVSEACYNEVNKFMKLFNCKSYKEMREIAGSDEEMKILVDEIEKLNKEKFFGALYNVEEEKDLLVRSAKSEGLQEGINIGKEEGINIGKEEGISIGKEKGALNKSIEIAKKMKKENLDIEFISRMTNLSKEQIEKLL